MCKFAGVNHNIDSLSLWTDVFRQDDFSVLIADVSVTCQRNGQTTDEYANVVRIAWTAVAIYPVGLIAVTSVLLLLARKDVRSQKLTPFSVAVKFLFHECIATSPTQTTKTTKSKKE